MRLNSEYGIQRLKLCANVIAQIVFNRSAWRYYTLPYENQKQGLLSELCSEIATQKGWYKEQKCEVIGNIYENKEDEDVQI